MIKIVLAGLALMSLSACVSVDADGPETPGVAVEREYTTGSMLPQKKAKRNSDVKTVNSDDFVSMPRATTPMDPMGKK